MSSNKNLINNTHPPELLKKQQDSLNYDNNLSKFSIPYENLQNENIIKDRCIELSFLEELKLNKNLLEKLLFIVETVQRERNYDDYNDEIKRNMEFLYLNAGFLYQLIQIFLYVKLVREKNMDSFLDTKREMTNDGTTDNKLINQINNLASKFLRKDQILFTYQKIKIIKLYFLIICQFNSLRNKYPHYFYASYDEENRYILSLRKIFYYEGIIEKESKIGFLYLRTLKVYLLKILKNIENHSNNLMSIVKLGYYITKLSFFCYLSADFTIFKPSNLFEQSISDKRWKNIFDKLKIEVVGGLGRAKLAHHLAKFFTTFVNTLYYFNHFDKFDYSIFKLSKLAISTILIVFSSAFRKYLRLYYTLYPNLNITKLIFNSPELGIINIYYSIFRERALIEKDISIINNELYLKFIPSWKHKYSNLKENYKLKFLANFINEFDDNRFFGTKYILKNAKIFQKILEKHFKKLHDFEKYKKDIISLFGIKTHKSKTLRKNMIFCLHGGGFIAQNTESHMGYLSYLIKETENFIISYDYILAPENKLDKIIEESIKAFEFIYFFSEKILGIEIENYMLMGDSAGALLSMNLLNHIIRKNYKKPKAIMLIYPCSRIVFDQMCPSSLYALTDLMIDTPYLSQLMHINLDMEKFYTGKLKIDERFDIFLTDKEIIKQYPKSFIVFGSTDPIRDESYRLADFLLVNNVEVDIKEYLFFNHGFLNISSFIDPYYIPAVDHIKNKICDVLNFDKYK